MFVVGISALSWLSTTFWDEEFWLPPNTTWRDIQPSVATDSSGQIIRIHTAFWDVLYPLPMALIMLMIRFVFEHYWFAPIGLSLGIRTSKPKRLPSNEVLEKAFMASPKKWSHKQVLALAKQLDISSRQVERWLRIRRGQSKPSTLTKFCENSWRCLYYCTSFTYGVCILWDKEWLWDINKCWRDYPHQQVTNDVWWYYMLSMSFYWSLSISQFFDVKRKDFWQMFVHHIATIVLMGMSWVVNCFRIGTLVLLVHDAADIFLEAAKMAKYSGYQKLCDAIFAVFTVLWIVTRLGIFPFWIVRNTSISAPTMVPMFPAYYFFNGLLILLLVLHCFWTWLIIRIVVNSLSAGCMEGDIRSSSDDNDHDYLSEASNKSQ